VGEKEGDTWFGGNEGRNNPLKEEGRGRKPGEKRLGSMQEKEKKELFPPGNEKGKKRGGRRTNLPEGVRLRSKGFCLVSRERGKKG